MPRPVTKYDLIKTANEQFQKMWGLIDSMAEEERKAVLNFGNNIKGTEAHWKRDKNLRDILVHLYEWHQLLLNWINSNIKGDTKPFLPDPYNWKTYTQLNEVFWKRHQSTEYDVAKEMLLKSHRSVMDVIEQFTDEELFMSKYFSWTGTTSLGSYCVSVTSSHYDWAIKKIKMHIKTYRS